MAKIRVAVLFGGQSAEHEVSLQSAKNICEALDPAKYEVVPIGIDKSGRWYLNDSRDFLLNAHDPRKIELRCQDSMALSLKPGGENCLQAGDGNGHGSEGIDVVFPVLHGTLGEDGCVQGLLKLANLAFVGADVLGSAVGMDKDVMKRLLRDADIPIGKFLVYHRFQRQELSFERCAASLGSPLFIKPANMGSSVGIHKVADEKHFQAAVDDAFQYDEKILIEETIYGREIEVAVLGNEEPLASVPGEIIVHKDFYSYEAKYVDSNGASLEIPAKLPNDVVLKVQELAKKTFRALCCQGMARVDFFVTAHGKIYVNEINTIPGFTKISMYPKLWEHSGVPYGQLLDRLIALAMAKHAQRKKLKTSL